jgi:hypothetical protein
MLAQPNACLIGSNQWRQLRVELPFMPLPAARVRVQTKRQNGGAGLARDKHRPAALEGLAHELLHTGRAGIGETRNRATRDGQVRHRVETIAACAAVHHDFVRKRVVRHVSEFHTHTDHREIRVTDAQSLWTPRLSQLPPTPKTRQATHTPSQRPARPRPRAPRATSLLSTRLGVGAHSLR